MFRHFTIIVCGSLMLAGCAKEPPPRSVNEFVNSPNLLEAAMVRCSQDRSKTRYDAECVNARLAVSRIQAGEEAAQKAALEASSERKRDALRRTQAAAAEARRRAAEAERLREEAEYSAQFGVLPSATGQVPEQSGDGAAAGSASVLPDSGNAAVTEQEATSTAPNLDAEPAASDLETIRDELRRRNEEGSGD